MFSLVGPIHLPLYISYHTTPSSQHIYPQGIEKGTLAMMNDILLETLGARELAFLSGPSFARCVRISAFWPCRVSSSFGFVSFLLTHSHQPTRREIMLEQVTCVVVASDSEALANEVKKQQRVWCLLCLGRSSWRGLM